MAPLPPSVLSELQEYYHVLSSGLTLDLEPDPFNTVTRKGLGTRAYELSPGQNVDLTNQNH